MELEICRSEVLVDEIDIYGETFDWFSERNRARIAHVYRNPFSGRVIFQDCLINLVARGYV